eukprot:CAMPEP_0206064092 /NCGR_PEP_ID=MMETSP1466-20131121/58554_1 /ASSEMBLY_ACC=CAM_ASM_001126 /TAXON_ID=44452 /ORGANISM="Pavlova gyrans, Strain CCMP608" /LENGTH=705 /DNA_ID=CAMNT_0053439465 /DNA_START=92 /DNA_END=2209 /DNA_ORIENTATION=-
MFNRIFTRSSTHDSNEDYVVVDAAAPAAAAPGPHDASPPPYAAAAADAAAAAPTASLAVSSEFETVAASDAKAILSLASVSAGALPTSQGNDERTPTELVAVVDVSGSMAGENLRLMKKALTFVVEKGLNAHDSLAIVTFCSRVDVPLPFVRMDAGGKLARTPPARSPRKHPASHRAHTHTHTYLHNTMFNRIFGRSSTQDSIEHTMDVDAASPAAAAPAPHDAPPPPYAAAAASAAAAAPTASLAVSSEFETVAASDAKTILSLASVRAGALPTSQGNDERTPTELVAVVDVSGSMAGENLRLMKKALTFVVEKGLNAHDSLAIVTFCSRVDVPLPFVRMDAAGKKAALRCIASLKDKDATNLSGGLLQGLDLMAQRVARAGNAGQLGVTRSVVLFTDGLANNGITDTATLREAVRQVLPQTGGNGNGCAVFTFGFGRNHNEDMLRTISDATSGGQYFFLENPEAIPVAFADALGGLVSVVAQNAELCAEAAPEAARLVKVLGSAYPAEVEADGSRVVVRLGDLYAEDEKDILIELHLPAVAVEGAAPPATVRWTLRYFNVARRAFETVDAGLVVARAAAVPEDQPVNATIEEHRGRLLVAEAMEAAAAVADTGDVAGGQAMLVQAQEQLRASPAAATASPMYAALVQDLDTVAEQYGSRAQYEAEGRKTTWMTSKAHNVQRSAMARGGAYEKKSKARMKASFA